MSECFDGGRRSSSSTCPVSVIMRLHRPGVPVQRFGIQTKISRMKDTGDSNRQF